MLNNKENVMNIQDKCEITLVDKEKVAQSKEQLLPDDVYAEAAEIFSALADSNRAKILYTLMKRALCVCDIAAVIGISDSAVSQHLRILRTLRLVKQRKEGRMMYYSLNDDHVEKLLAVCLDHLRHE